MASPQNAGRRIVCCQFEPKLFDVKGNMEKADNLLQSLKKGDVDLVILPEMSFTGYVFKNREEIEPLMENEYGPTFQWCKIQALRLDAYVAAGYPLKTEDDHDKTKYYNSMCLVGPHGELVCTYSKHFLYETDKTWADAGTGFQVLDVPRLGGKIGIGICMDVNPWEYKDSSLFEFANFHKQRNTQLLIFLANWLLSNSNYDSDEDGKDSAALDTQNYWFNRLRPLWGSKCHFVACNRIGTERDSTFCGSSCVIALQHRALVASLTKNEEGLLAVTL